MQITRLQVTLRKNESFFYYIGRPWPPVTRFPDQCLAPCSSEFHFYMHIIEPKKGLVRGNKQNTIQLVNTDESISKAHFDR